MRIRIIFQLQNKGAILPFHHQSLICSLLKNTFGNSLDLNSVHFNFSGLKGQTKVGKEGLHYFSKRVTLVFSSFNVPFLDNLIQRIFLHKELSLGELILVPEFVEKEIIPSFGESSKFLCISPIVIANTKSIAKNKEFLLPTSDEFSDLLYESTMQRMEHSGYYTTKEIESFFKFQIIPDVEYLKKIQGADKKFARIYGTIYKNEIKEIRGYTFPFQFYAHPKVQDFIYHCGFGELTQNGFGMLDLVAQEAVKREIYYQPEETVNEFTFSGVGKSEAKKYEPISALKEVFQS
jgi:CRISPR-associated endoribonuclease Cas6